MEGIVDPIEAVAARMEQIAAPLGEDDGVRRFNELYLAVTRAVAAESASATFEDPRFISRLDVIFADLYFAAIEDDDGARELPRAWAPLFERRAATGIAPLQFAIGGMNAHINHDLALALVEVGIDPERERRYADHTRVNEVLEIATATMKSEVSRRYAPLLSRLDRLGGRLDDDATNFSIPRAREHAWTFALALTSCTSEAETRRLQQALDTQAAVLARLILASPTRHPIVVQTVRVAKKVDRVLRRLVPFWSRR